MARFLQTLAFFAIVAFVKSVSAAVCDNSYYLATTALRNYQGCVSTSCKPFERKMPRDCADIRAQGHTTSGLYAVYYFEGTIWTPVRVYCDMETTGGGWLVFQRRQDGSEDFYRNWKDYANGFGDQSSEFWLGNANLHKLTSGRQYKLRVDVEDFEGEKRYAEYSSFQIGDVSTNFTLSVSGYSGDAGDALSYHDGQKFSTKDEDNDLYGGACAIKFKGAWWYNACHYSNLNGLYLGGPHDSLADGIEWIKWKVNNYSFKFTEMKFKPI